MNYISLFLRVCEETCKHQTQGNARGRGADKGQCHQGSTRILGIVSTGFNSERLFVNAFSDFSMVFLEKDLGKEKDAISVCVFKVQTCQLR